METQKNTNILQNNLLFNSPISNNSFQTNQIKDEVNLYKLVTSPASLQFSSNNNLASNNSTNSDNFYNQSKLQQQHQQIQKFSPQKNDTHSLNQNDALLNDVKSLDEILNQQNDPLLSNSVLYSDNLMESFG